MATLRTFEEKAAIVEHCIELEQTGGDILGYLWSQNYYTPRATWCNIQREWLHRKPYEYTDGKPKKKGEAIMKSKFIVTPEIRDEAIRIAINGGDPRNYLTGMGSQNGMSAWTKIRMELKKTNPEKFAKLPKRICKAEVPEMPTVKVDGPLKIETPEAGQIQVAEAPETYIKITKDRIEAGVQKKIEMAVCCEELEISAVRHPQLGEFYFDHDHNSIDWRDPFGDEVSVSPDLWKKMHETLPKILNALGVEL